MGRGIVRGLGLVVVAALLATCSSGDDHAGRSQKGFKAPTEGYVVYWDQNEELDYYASATGEQGQLIPPWDPNGQMCLLGDDSGRFVVGYNPTVPAQHNPGGKLPYKDPPIGEELVDRHGKYTGTALFVPGPYALPGKDVGGDIPPDDDGDFNGHGTFTGCAVDADHNVFANDLGTGQGDFPVPDDGRLIEWFAPSYDTYCIVAGPTTGGDGPHHVNGHGGLRQPGAMTVDPASGDLLLPEAGAPSGFGGRVLRIDHASLPKTAADCPGGLYPRDRLRTSVFFQGSADLMPFPMAIARDPMCDCWAIDTAFGDPAFVWVDDAGTVVADRPTIPGQTIAELGQDPDGFNPFGMAFAPDGTLYFVDIHIQCAGQLTDCGPTNGKGRVLRVRFTDGKPSRPETLADGFSFPTSATICVASQQTCPFPDKKTPAPRKTTSAEGAEG